jgi:nucleoid-associated protein YgaU
MNLKNILKMLKVNESTISMMLGALVIVVVGLLVVNYFRNTEPGSTFPEGLSTGTTETQTLPTTHVVQSGETLWDIAENYYGSGYNWVDIAKANNLSSADVISEGEKLTIPALEGTPLAQASASPSAIPQASVTPSSSPSLKPSPSPSASPQAVETPAPGSKGSETVGNDQQITGDSYTVVHGDNLWDIAVRAYGDGFQWVKIAEANNLANPSLIHAGNHFVIPR